MGYYSIIKIMANNKSLYSSGFRRGTEDTESDFRGMKFDDSRQIENFTMNPTIKKNPNGRMTMRMNRKSSTAALFKVILLGDSLVGKSSIVLRLVVSCSLYLIGIERAILSGASANPGFRLCKHTDLLTQIRVSRS
jgi:hypothetical protein